MAVFFYIGEFPMCSYVKSDFLKYDVIMRLSPPLEGDFFNKSPPNILSDSVKKEKSLTQLRFVFLKFSFVLL